MQIFQFIHLPWFGTAVDAEFAALNANRGLRWVPNAIVAQDMHIMGPFR